MARRAELASLDLPEFGLPSVEPIIPAEIYRARLAALYERARAEGYQLFLVYGDREHFANLAYLTNYDPRFEEALLILNIEKEGQEKPLLLVGNEGFSYTNISPIKDDLAIELYQSFSLLGQPRERSRPLRDILQETGVRVGVKVGVAGWKHFDSRESSTPRSWLEIPAYIVDTLRELVGNLAQVENANAILMDSSRGLRAINDVHQLARFEFVATYTSQAVRNVVFGVKPGMTEFEAVQLMQLNGLPLSCHLMLSAGPRAFIGLPSPSLRKMERGEPFTTAYGAWGALNCRAGWLVESADELPVAISDYVEKLVVPYFEAVAGWYEHIGLGVAGGDLYQLVHERIGDAFFGVGLNPGHLIHLDEWVHSPIYQDSAETLQSGMALQVDIIPATGTAYFTTNIEDGIALADATLRRELAALYPEAWGRIVQRRDYMEDVLNIRLKPEVLPFSNIPAYLPPFLLAPQQAMRMVE